MKVNQKLALAVSLSVALTLAGQPALANDDSRFQVEDIRIEGLQRVSRGAALTYLPVRVGDQLDPARAARLIRSLYSSGNFDDVQLLRDGDTLVVQVTERPTISNILFTGNKDIKDEQLQESLDGSGVRVGDPLDRTKLSQVEQGLEDFYHSSGKYSADVQTIVTPLPRNRIDLKVVVKEGEAAGIRQINIIGNRVYPEALLLEQMELRDKVPWWNLFASNRYQKQLLQGDIEALRSYYMDRGYIRADVESTQVAVSADKKDVYVTLSINEGEQYKVESLTLTGDLLDKRADLEALMPVAAGDMYSAADVTYAEELVANYLGRFGYAYPQVRTFPEIDDETREVSLTMNIEPGSRIHVNRINFSGNELTADEVLRREMRQLEGAWLSNVSVEQSRSRLMRLGYFKGVDIKTSQSPVHPDQVDLDVRVAEQPTGSVNFGIGYGTSGGISLQAGVQQDNFLGTGNRVSLNANTNDFSKVFDFSFDDPYFTVDGISFGSRIFYSEYDSKADNGQDFKQSSAGLEFDYGIPINEYNRLTAGIGGRGDNIDPNPDDISYQQLRFFDNAGGYSQWYNNLELSLGWSRNNLNRGSFPTAGSITRLSGTFTAPGISDINWYKINFSNRKYFPLSTDHTWAFMLNTRLGYGDGADGDILPFWENFRSGQTIRGFQSNTIGPRSIRLLTDVNEDGCPPLNGGSSVSDWEDRSECVEIRDRSSLGGNAMAVISGEVFFPMPGLNESYKDTVRTSIFVDVGNVWDTNFSREDLPTFDKNGEEISDYSDPFRFRVSAGLSVQWLSPLGAMIFSLGYPIVDQSGDKSQPFNFTIGRTF